MEDLTIACHIKKIFSSYVVLLHLELNNLSTGISDLYDSLLLTIAFFLSLNSDVKVPQPCSPVKSNLTGFYYSKMGTFTGKPLRHGGFRKNS